LPRGLKIALALALIILAAIAAITFDLKGGLRSALVWIDSLGPWAPAVFILLYIVATVLFVPAWLLTVGGGALFGVLLGSIYTSIGSTLGATCAFLIGRSLARDILAKRLNQNPRLKALDDALARQGWKIVGLVRLSPIFPYNLMNYAFGLTRVSLRDYFLASWVGMLPGTVMYVYFGSLAKSLAELGTGHDARTPLQWALYGIGLAATITITVYLTRLARSALRTNVGTE
jgi:uncharacterized membrane protein YdjX (TVP38/TMEM64 family)